MSDITTAEKVWVSTSKNGDYVSAVNVGDGTEYIRADLVSQWMPIETAPKDGTVVLIYEPSYLGVDSGTIYTASWDCDYYNTWIEAGGERYMSFDDATHWQPLPTPPPAT